MKTVLRGAMLATALCTTLSLEAQVTPKITITPFSEAGVTFSAYDPAASPALARFVQNHPEIKPLLPYSTILANSSNKSIVELAVRWSCADLPGGPPVGCLVFRQEGTFLVRMPVAAAGSKLLVTPGGTWSESTANNVPPNPNATEGNSLAAAKFGRRAAVSVNVDLIIFEDGLVAGPDISGTLDRVRARKQAAQAILDGIAPLLQAGDDPTGLLQDFSKRGADVGGELGRWYSEISGMLLQSFGQQGPRFQALMGELSRMSDVSNLHRSQ